MLVALTAMSALAACGNEGDDGADTASDASSETTSESPTDEASEPAGPGDSTECSDIWVDGQTLAEDYASCTSEGETIKPVKKKCGYGATFLEQDGRFYAMAGGPITDAGDLETNPEYQQLLATCQA